MLRAKAGGAGAVLHLPGIGRSLPSPADQVHMCVCVCVRVCVRMCVWTAGRDEQATIAVGVGLASVLGTLRMIKGWR